jgi:PHD/YefM family antitoxin component YafN of YafNO toxin-antitoxin module
MYKENFVTDNKGKRIAVMISIKDYNKIKDELEELEDIRDYDNVKARNESSITLREAIKLRKQKKNA